MIPNFEVHERLVLYVEACKQKVSFEKLFMLLILFYIKLIKVQ